MAKGHYCKIHKTPFFKTANMRGYAHPIKDGEGKTIEWCNEDAQEVAKLEPQEPISPPPQEGEPTPEQLKPFDPTRKSIERQKALDIAERWCSVKVQGGVELNVYDVLIAAKVFESYLDTGVVVEKKK